MSTTIKIGNPNDPVTATLCYRDAAHRTKEQACINAVKDLEYARVDYGSGRGSFQRTTIKVGVTGVTADEAREINDAIKAILARRAR